MIQNSPYRRTRAHISPLGISLLHLRNPWVCAFFSFSLPGFGNLMQDRYLKAFTLIGWEVFINTHAKINLGIMYSLFGQFDKARQVLDERWLLLYAGIYLYAIWDSYRGTVDMNKQAMLAEREKAPLQPIRISAWDMNFLDKRQPWVALVWSALSPGLGHLYVHKVITGFFLFAATIATMYFSHLPLAIFYSMIGDFPRVIRTIDMQWALYLPSVYAFVFYDAYIAAVEGNKLFEKEQADYLRRTYPSGIRPPFSEWTEDRCMYVVATFEHSTYVELALTELEQNGIPRDRILAIPLDKRTISRNIWDSIHRSDGFSVLDLAAVLGTVGMLLGSIYGFVLAWGPIIWGIIGAVAGLLTGGTIKWFIVRRRSRGKGKGKSAITSEVVCLIQCAETDRPMVERVLWDNLALGVSRLKA